ncbi:VOC family protein [Dyadobacter sp. CY356]|uniref:VOC family protein n=1 Tax=Dyadobacter sp. CY356 TaxID=2906442 RepID=UPI001F32CC96|nr:VOC family protein [Dyadobacter sp. CY356]MCF0057989.1 glyoxalase/bleomycin resistance/extradiol dioxygenase family protein [Dyadobacter sp. CY356]
MTNHIFVNMAVKDPARSEAFFTKLGYTFNAKFSSENAATMIIADNIYVMFIAESFFKELSQMEIPDTRKYAQSCIVLSAESREEVDKVVNLAVEAGGVARDDIQDQGFMYGHSFADLDGHLWEVSWMDPAAFQD